VSKPTPLAESCADVIRARIRTAPGGRWLQTGTLLRSVDADGTAVTVRGGRLQRDETAALFAAECVLDPTDETAFVEALDEVITELLEEAFDE